MVFTPKALHPIAQGCPRSGLPWVGRPHATYPEGVASPGAMHPIQPLRGRETSGFGSQGSREYAATLGYGIQPLRGKDIRSNPHRTQQN
jgi:hypothetical protein